MSEIAHIDQKENKRDLTPSSLEKARMKNKQWLEGERQGKKFGFLTLYIQIDSIFISIFFLHFFSKKTIN